MKISKVFVRDSVNLPVFGERHLLEEFLAVFGRDITVFDFDTLDGPNPFDICIAQSGLETTQGLTCVVGRWVTKHTGADDFAHTVVDADICVFAHP